MKVNGSETAKWWPPLQKKKLKPPRKRNYIPTTQVPPEEYLLEENEERSMIEPKSYDNPKLKSLIRWSSIYHYGYNPTIDMVIISYWSLRRISRNAQTSVKSNLLIGLKKSQWSMFPNQHSVYDYRIVFNIYIPVWLW